MKHEPELGAMLTEVLAGLQNPVQASQPDIKLPKGVANHSDITRLFNSVVTNLLLQESITEGQFSLIQTLIPYTR